MREQKQRESERRKEEAAAVKERDRREKAVAKAQAAIEKATAEHEKRASTIETERGRKTVAGGGRALGEAEKEAGDGCTAGPGDSNGLGTRPSGNPAGVNRVLERDDCAYQGPQAIPARLAPTFSPSRAPSLVGTSSVHERKRRPFQPMSDSPSGADMPSPTRHLFVGLSQPTGESVCCGRCLSRPDQTAVTGTTALLANASFDADGLRARAWK